MDAPGDAVIACRTTTPARYAIAAVSILILAGALAFSKRKATPMDDTPETETVAATAS